MVFVMHSLGTKLEYFIVMAKIEHFKVQELQWKKYENSRIKKGFQPKISSNPFRIFVTAT